jgi:uncharacterized protein (DUF1697 family)
MRALSVFLSGNDLVIYQAKHWSCMTERKKDRVAKPAGRESAAQAYIAMLRGINVSGKNIVKMEQLRASLAALGFGNVKTYVQSGNVIFEASNETAASLSRKIEQKIVRDFGFSVPVFLKTAKEMEEAIQRNPFLQAPDIDHSKLHITFLSDAPPKTALEQLQPLAVKPEQFRIGVREIYLYCPNGYGQTKLSNTAIERKLSVGATTRNWTTANTLLAMAQ